MSVEKIAQIVGFALDAVCVPLKKSWTRRRERTRTRRRRRARIGMDSADEKEEENEFPLEFIRCRLKR